MIIGAVAILMFGGYSRNITYGLQTDYVSSAATCRSSARITSYMAAATRPPTASRTTSEMIDVIEHDPVLAPMLKVVTPTLALGGIAGNFAAGVSRTALAPGSWSRTRTACATGTTTTSRSSCSRSR